MNPRPPKKIWESALGELQIQLTKANYDTWLRDTTGISYRDNQFVVGTPNGFAAEWLDKRLSSLIQKTLIGIIGEELDVSFQVYQGNGSSFQSNKAPQKHVRLQPPKLNPKYTFDYFIVGSSNRLAHAASLAVAENSGRSYNPLFIYSGSGLGKTHLLHAIAHESLKQDLHVLYVTTEQFTNDFINAIREKKTEEFRNKYRTADVLLLDDIQFITGKEQTQESFFHTFNELHNANHQIVLTSDRPPKSMSLLEDRLRSRFEWGLIVDIQPPDLETRLAILKAKTEQQGIALAQDVLDLIARRFQKNIRELEGALNRVIACSMLSREPVTIELANKALQDVAPVGTAMRFSPQSVIKTVSAYFDISPDSLLSKRRNRDVALARQIAMYLIREELHLPYADIGRELGGRGHVAVLYGYQKISNDINDSPQLRHDIIEIRDLLYSTPQQKET